MVNHPCHEKTTHGLQAHQALGSAEVTFFPGDLQLEADPFHEFFLAEGLPGGHWRPWPWAESKKDTKLDDGWPESEKRVFQAALSMVVVKNSR